jgi:hypothetical protein
MYRRIGRFATVAAAALAAGSAIAGVVTGLGMPSSASERSAASEMSAASEAAASERPASAGTRVAASSTSSGAPNYVRPDALPQGPRFGTWDAGDVVAGMPARPPFCLSGAFDPARTSFRPYSANAKVGADELVSVLPTAADANAFEARLQTQLEGCYKSWLAQDIPAYRNRPRSASWAKYAGSDNPTLYGVFTVPPEGFDHATHLYAVGRRGATVMVLHLVVVGDRATAPVDAFQRSAEAALATMY